MQLHGCLGVGVGVGVGRGRGLAIVRKLARERRSEISRLQSELEVSKNPALISTSTELSPFIGIGP